MPAFTELKPEEAKKNSNADLVELKQDGCCMNWDGTEFKSERGIERSDRFPQIIDDLQQIDAVVQGEVAVPGGNVLQVNTKINWPKARFYLFDVTEWKGKDMIGNDVRDNRRIINQILRSRFKHLRSCREFDTFQAGWDFVLKQKYAEGLILKSDVGKSFKVKYLKEVKVPIVGFEPGSVKGAFLIQMPTGEVGKVSGTSVDFVAKRDKIVAAGDIPFAEIEYQFLTDNGIPFQPRLRNVDVLANL